MAKDQLPFKVAHNEYVNSFMNQLSIDKKDSQKRKIVLNLIKKSYVRGYNKAVKHSTGRYLILDEIKTNWKEYYLDKSKTITLSQEDVAVVFDTMKTFGFPIYGINEKQYRTNSRKRCITDFHKSIFYIFYEFGMYHKSIAKMFDKDHSSSVVAIQTFHELVENDKTFAKKFELFIKVLQVELDKKNFRLPLPVLIKAGIYDVKEGNRYV